MTLDDLVRDLDAYFDVASVSDDSWTTTFDDLYDGDGWRGHVEPAHADRWNGLMIRGRTTQVTNVVTCVFPCASLIASLAPGTLLFAEHPIDLVDDVFTPLPLASLALLRERGAGLYQVHATFDHHPAVSPSALLGKSLGLRDVETFYPVASGIAGGAIVAGRTDATVEALACALAATLGVDVPVRLHSSWREDAGRVAIAAGGGADASMLAACIARGCNTYVTGNAITSCTLPFVVDAVAAFTDLAVREQVTVIDGTHEGTERPSQLAMVDWFQDRGLPARCALRDLRKQLGDLRT